jgi:hypothetical protein
MNTEETTETTGVLIESHNSSIIETTKFVPNEQELFVSFKNGATYVYTEFSQADYDEFMNAESKGVHFGRVIRKNFTATKLEDI